MNKYHNRKRSILIALFLALLGLTVLPGFKCTAEDANGNKVTVESN
jgi:hypothetical protein